MAPNAAPSLEDRLAALKADRVVCYKFVDTGKTKVEPNFKNWKIQTRKLEQGLTTLQRSTITETCFRSGFRTTA